MFLKTFRTSQTLSQLNSLDGNSGVVGDPLSKAAGTGESIGQAVFASQRGDEGGDTNGSVSAIGFNEAQRATAVAVAGARALSDRGTDDPVGDDGAIDIAAFSVGYNGGESLAQNRADRRNAVRGTAPSRHDNRVSSVVGFSGRRQADGLDVGVEANGGGKADQSDVASQGVGIPGGVDDLLGGTDFNTVGFRGQANVVSAQEDIKVGRSISAVSSSHDPLVTNQRAAAERSTSDEQGAHPGEFIRSSLNSTDDLCWGLNTAGGAEILGGDSGKRLVDNGLNTANGDFSPSNTKGFPVFTEQFGNSVHRIGQCLRHGEQSEADEDLHVMY